MFPVCSGWTLMLGLTGIPALIELLLLPFFPESPRYTLIQKGDETKAKKGDNTQKLVYIAGRQKLVHWDIDCNLCSASFFRPTAPAWLGWCEWRAARDASGGPIGEGRRPRVCALPAVPALASLAAGLHHNHKHGPAAVRGQRGEMCLSICPWRLPANAQTASHIKHSYIFDSWSKQQDTKHHVCPVVH